MEDNMKESGVQGTVISCYQCKVLANLEIIKTAAIISMITVITTAVVLILSTIHISTMIKYDGNPTMNNQGSYSQPQVEQPILPPAVESIPESVPDSKEEEKTDGKTQWEPEPLPETDNENIVRAGIWVPDPAKAADFDKNRLYLGVIGRNVSLEESINDHIPRGFYIEEVVDGSGAQLSGLKAGMIITGVDGIMITGSGDLESILKNHSEGDVVSVDIIRYVDANPEEIPVKLIKFQ